jgi:hypothetical protein
MMKRIILVTSQTGGVGKSTTSCAIVDVARSIGVITAAYDTDTRKGRVGKLLKRYGERDANGVLLSNQNPTTGVGYFDARDPKAREQLIGLIDDKAELVVVDLPGGSLTDLADVVPGGLGGLTKMYGEYGWEPIIVIVVTPVKICAEEVVEVLPRLTGCGAKIVVAKNFGATGEHVALPEDIDQREFFLFNGDGGIRSSGRARTLLHEAGGLELLIPCIRARSYTYVDSFDLPFSIAAQRDDEAREYRGDQRWMRDWLDKMHDRFVDAQVLPDLTAEVIQPKAVVAAS